MLPEVELYLARLSALRNDTLKTMEGASAGVLNWKPTARETNSMFVLATHLLGSERHWIHRVVGGLTIARDRDAEFRARGKDAENFRGEYAALAQASAEILARLSEAELSAPRVTPNYGTVSARWAIVHLIEHYAEHAGQMSLTRQVWEAGQQSKSKKHALSVAEGRKAKSRKSPVKRARGKK